MHERAEADFASDYTMTRRCTWVVVAALPPFVGKLEQARSRCPLHHLIDDDTLFLIVSFDLDVSTAPGCYPQTTTLSFEVFSLGSVQYSCIDTR